MGSIGSVSNPNMVSVIHYTDEANINSLLNNEFDFSRSGEAAGDVWEKVLIIWKRVVMRMICIVLD